MRPRRWAALVFVLGGLVPVVVGAPPAYAANITVTSAADAGPGTLRQAVLNAAPGDTITVSSALNGVPIQVTSAPIVINKNLTIRGNGDGITLIAGTPPGDSGPRIFEVTAGTVVIDAIGIVRATTVVAPAGIEVEPGANLTLSRSRIQNAFSRGNAGAIENGGTMTIRNTVLTLNQANSCGAIFNAGTMTVTDSLVHNNRAEETSAVDPARGGGICNSQGAASLSLANTDVTHNAAVATDPAGDALGGGIFNFNSATLTMTDGAIRSNLAQGGSDVADAQAQGGGIWSNGLEQRRVRLDRVEVSANTATAGSPDRRGGGIFSILVQLTVTNSTFSANQARLGGAVFAHHAANISSSTLASNTADNGSNIASTIGPVILRNTINANSGPGPMCDGPVADGENNLAFGGGGIGSCPGIIADPQLGPLAFNGGPTQTMALGDGSAAINAGADCPGVDQRQFPRNVGTCDIGAFEFGSTLNDATPPACAVSALRADNPRQMDVTVQDNLSGLATIAPTLQQNAVVALPYFQPGTRNPVVVTATKLNQAQVARWAFNTSDLAGNNRTCT